MPAVFAQHGITFEYPENWHLEGPEVSGKGVSVSVSSPDAAFWAVTAYGVSVEPSELLQEAVAAMRSEYASLEADEVEEWTEGLLLLGFDLSFYYVDLVNSAMLRAFEAGGSSYLLLYQAEDREMGALEPVFEAMTASLIRHLQED